MIIRNRRAGLRMSLEELGRKAGTTKGYLSGIENGKVHPPLPRKVSRLCKILELDEAPMLLLAYVEKAPGQIKDIDSFKKFSAEAQGLVQSFFRPTEAATP
jgi:transcriptional regulator with XRE-family HTH domain